VRANLAAALAVEHVTPIAVVDGAVLDANLGRMADYAATNRVRLRPHGKTHKSAAVAKRQLELGAIGITAATLVEGRMFVEAGVDDLLIAHPPVGAKVRGLAALAARTRRLAVALDDVTLASALPESVDVLWEVDTGLHRIGTVPGAPTVDAVKSLVRAIGARRFRGLITHGGHVYRAENPGQRAAAAAQEAEGLLETADAVRKAGIEVRELSIGSTPTMGVHSLEGITEIRPGTYAYGDANQVALGVHGLEDCALAVVATVVSTPAADRAVVDAGSKALSADLRVPGLSGFGIVLEHPHLTVARLSEEHAVLTAEGDTGLHVGDVVVIVPSHVCTVVNLHSELAVISSDGSVRMQPVDARGWR
jgi:D-serine deaminase-like pyridoxal phosphate-dependent protein